MPVMDASNARRVGLVLAALAVVLAAAVDLLSPESLLRGAWEWITPDRESPTQQRIEHLRTRVRSVRP
jgi:hypothetical protein